MTTLTSPDLESNIREDLRRYLRERLREELDDATVERTVAVSEPKKGRPPEDGWTSLPVVTRRQWGEALSTVFYEPLPAPNEITAEVRTPSEILVWAECPRCKLPHAIRLFVSPVLTIDAAGSQLKLKATAKAAYHVCGQQPLLPRTAAAPQAEGQVAAFDVPIDPPADGAA